MCATSRRPSRGPRTVRPVPRLTVDRLVVNSDGLAHGLIEDGGVASSEVLSARFGLPTCPARKAGAVTTSTTSGVRQVRRSRPDRSETMPILLDPAASERFGDLSAQAD